MLTIQQALEYYVSYKVEQREVQSILAFVLKKNRAYVLSHGEEKLTLAQEQIFNLMLVRLKDGEPLAYILGEKEFYSLMFKVNHKVLIPRPETEQLVDLILGLPFSSANNSNINNNIRMLDLGCGSGVISIVVAKYKPTWQIVAVDISDEALAIAKENAQLHGVTNMEFMQSNWFTAIEQDKTLSKSFEIIVSNPPYIAEEAQYLEDKSLSFEPRLALISGAYGLDALLELITFAKKYLTNGGYLLLEHGFDQQKTLYNELVTEGYVNIKLYKDLAGIDRICLAQWLD